MATKRSVSERRRSRRRAMIVVVPTLAGVFIAGTAFAYWTTSGSGTGTTTSGTGQSVTVTQTGTVPSGLAPGGADQGVSFKITNPKASPQRIASVQISVASVVKTSDGTAAVGCSASDFNITQPATLNADVPNGDTNFTAVATGAAIHMVESGSNQDGCKNTTVNLAFAAA
jgi:hypothetical protein